MGIITAREGRRRYTIELEGHLSRRKPETELPVEDLHAIFLESPFSREGLQGLLKEPEAAAGTAGPLPFIIKDRKLAHIVRRAEKSGTELWFGDVNTTDAENLASFFSSIGVLSLGATAAYGTAGLMTRRKALKSLAALAGMAAVSILPLERLTAKGNANDRRISRFLVREQGQIDPTVYVRNRIIAHKIRTLTEKTGHTKVGLLFGAGHENLSQLLERPQPLTSEQHREIAKRGPEALKIFRCIFDKNAGNWRVGEHRYEGRWRVEEHSL